MVKIIKGYLVFTSLFYRIIMFGILPVAFIALDICAAAFKGRNVQVLLIIMHLLIVMVEVLADTWVFGGIQGKDAAKIDFLKTSPKGMGLLRNALVMDLVRRFLSLSVIMAACVLIKSRGVDMFGGDAVKGLGVTLSLILSSYAVTVLCIILARFASMLWQSMLAGYLGVLIESAYVGVLIALGHPLVWCFVFAVLAMGASILAVKVVMKYAGAWRD